MFSNLLQPTVAMVDPVRKSVISRNPGTPSSSSSSTPTYLPLTGSTLSALLTGSGEAYGDASRSSVLRSTPLASLFGDSGASYAQQQSPEYFYRYLKLTFLSRYPTLGAVLGIRGILVRIRILDAYLSD